MGKLNRRDFVRAAMAGGVALGTPVFGRAEGRVMSTALIGTGWWGMNILGSAIAAGRSRVVAMCDVDERQLKPGLEKVTQLTGSAPRSYRDFRELLKEQKPEVVIVATPDHWHPLITIAAVESGAHVYVEKPIGHTILEGRAMVKAARKAGRTVQVGTHRRVSPHNISGMEFLKSGRVGRVSLVRAFVYNGRDSAGEAQADRDAPAGLDWDMWCGPAPYRRFNPQIHPRGFRNFLDYANGTLGDWGIHWLDQILWWTEQKFPSRIYSTGGRHILRDASDAPDTQVATFDFDGFTVEWEHRMFGGNPEQPHQFGCFFYGTEGVFHMGWLDGWTFYPRKKGEPPVHREPRLHEPDQQNIPELWADFIDSIDTGRTPVCDIEIGHRSTTMSLLGMLSLKLGRSVNWDGSSERVPGDDEANRLLRRDYRSPWEYPEV